MCGRGFRVQDLGFRFYDLGFKIYNVSGINEKSVFPASDTPAHGLRVYGLGFRVYGLVLRV